MIYFLPFKGPLVACLLSVLELLDQSHYDRLWSEISERKLLKEFLLQMLSVLRTLTHQGEQIFPSDWRTMHCAVNKVLLSTLDNLTNPLVAHFLDSGWFDSQVYLIKIHLVCKIYKRALFVAAVDELFRFGCCLLNSTELTVRKVYCRTAFEDNKSSRRRYASSNGVPDLGTRSFLVRMFKQFMIHVL